MQTARSVQQGWRQLATVQGSGREPYTIAIKEDGTLGCSCRAATMGKYRGEGVFGDKHMIAFANKLAGQTGPMQVVRLVGTQDDLDHAAGLLRLAGVMGAAARV